MAVTAIKHMEDLFMQGKNEQKEKMNYEDFCICVHKDLQEQLSHVNATVQLQTITKNNNQKHKVLIISETGCTITPTVYLKGYYSLYLTGMMDLEHVELEIVKQYVAGTGFKFNVTDFTLWENISKKIVYRLVNYERNKELLQKIPHRKFLDLAITYYCLFQDDDMADNGFQSATAQITNQLLQLLNKIEEDIYQKAMENTFILLPYLFTGIENAVNGCFENAELAENDNPSFMYALTNEQLLYGSATILYPHLLQTISERVFAGADLYILPSSISEVMIMPVVKGIGCSELVEMVRDINKSELLEDEILSDSVYYYSNEKDEISICKGESEKNE